jgi:hypothetical protein
VSHDFVFTVIVPMGAHFHALSSIIIHSLFLCSRPQLFADDTTFLVEGGNSAELYSNANSLLDEAEDWFNANLLTLHPSKTKSMIFGAHNDELKNLDLYLCGPKISRIHENGCEKSFKLVGVHLDEKLTWMHHINHIKKKILRSFAAIITSKKLLPTKIKTLLYNSLIRPHLEYCVVIWGGASTTHLKPIKTLQKKAIRLICDANYNAHTDPLFYKLEQLKFEELYTLSCAKLAKGILNVRRVPTSVCDLFPIYESTSSVTRTNESKKLALPKYKNNAMEKLPQVKIPQMWNSLKSGLRSCSYIELLLNFKNQSLEKYRDFSCTNTKCYSCKSN